MTSSNANRFHPKRWTVLTWLMLLWWVWQGGIRNYAPSKSYAVDPVTGELSEPTFYKSLADIPFPVGWPLHYVRPGNRSRPLAPITPAGAIPAPPGPSAVSPFAMVANFLLIAAAIVALVYVLQKARYRFSLLFLFGVISAYPLYIGLVRLAAALGGYRAGWWCMTAVYFSPIPAAIAVRFSLVSRWKWPRFRPKWKAEPRAFEEYDNAADAIAAAARLERRGDWTTSIELYRHTAKCWPEEAEYIQCCIDAVTAKQSLARE